MKKIVYIDMDGVCCDFEKAWPLVAKPVWIPGQDKEVPVGFFENLEPIKGCVEAIHKLAEKFDVYILSTPQWSNPNSWSEKHKWVVKHLGEPLFKRLILSHHKRLNKGDYLIDDNVHEGFEGEHIHFGSSRFPDWESVVEYLLKPTSYDSDKHPAGTALCFSCENYVLENYIGPCSIEGQAVLICYDCLPC